MTYTPIAPGTPSWDVPVNAAFTDQDGRITANSSSITGLQTATGNLAWQASDQGLLTWTSDPTIHAQMSAWTSGTVHMIALAVRKAATVTNIYTCVQQLGSGLVSNQNFVGLYDSSGNQLAVSADQSVAWTTTGLKVASISPVSVSPGTYYVAVLGNGTTPAQFSRGAAAQPTMLNANTTNATARFTSGGTGLTGLTALPGTITMGTRTPGGFAIWTALS